MDNFKDINCRIVNIHGRISCQTSVRVCIFSFWLYSACSKVNLLSIYVFCTMLRSANSLKNVKTDINSITDFQNMPEYTNNKKPGLCVFERDIFINWGELPFNPKMSFIIIH